MTDQLSPRAFQDADGTGDWRVLGDGAAAFFRTDDLAASARFVSAIAELPGIHEHAPDIDVRHDGVTVRTVTSSDGPSA